MLQDTTPKKKDEHPNSAQHSQSPPGQAARAHLPEGEQIISLLFARIFPKHTAFDSSLLD